MSETSSQVLISILTPAYNAERFIAETLDSVLAQTHKNWEHLVVVDANSKDRTLQIVQEYAQKDSRIRCITSADALGAANNRNIGVKQSRGQFMAFVDSDDLWAPDKLEKQLRFMQERQIDFSFHSYRRISEQGERQGKVQCIPEVVDYVGLLSNNSIGCLTVMLRRSAFSEIQFSNKGWEDMACWLGLLRSGAKAYGLKEPLAYYRIVNGSRSNNKLFSAGLRWDTYRKVEKLPFLQSSIYFLQYALSSCLKHSRF
jgi:teichuronic acid biosynthesis glycosyltransferase TuaG